MVTKICSKCKIEKSFFEFNKGNDKNGLSYWCKSCAKQYNKQYKKDNALWLAEYRKQYDKDNAPRLAKRQKQYNKENASQILEQKKQWNRNNTPLSTKWKKQWNKNNALFETYFKQLEIFEEIRLCPENPKLLEVKCAYCGRWVIPTNLQVSNRLSAFKGTISGECRFYCSDACKISCPTYGQKLYWKGQDREVLGTSREVNAWFRQHVLETDDWTCQWCGKSKEEYPELVLHVHHTMGVELYPMLQNDIAYAYTACIDCHKKIHQKEGCTYYDLRRSECSKLTK